MEGLRSKDIGSQYLYVPLYYHPALAPALSQKPEEFPAMESYFSTALALPFFSSMAESDVDRVVASLRQVLFHL